jgi:hypothetical protein
MYKDAKELLAFLFGYDDGLVRNHWEDRPFRKLYRRTITAIGLMPGGLELQQVFEQQIGGYITQSHWVLPYPHSEGLMQTTKRGQRMWYSTWWQGKVWEWAGKRRQAGEPLALPEYVSWTKEDWEEWIQRQVRWAGHRRERSRVAEAVVVEGEVIIRRAGTRSGSLYRREWSRVAAVAEREVITIDDD